MKKLLLILLCVPLMFSCGENDEEKEEKETIIKEIRVHFSDKKYTYVDMKVYYDGNLFTGVLFNTYDNGQLEIETNYKDNRLIYEKCWDEQGSKIECE